VLRMCLSSWVKTQAGELGRAGRSEEPSKYVARYLSAPLYQVHIVYRSIDSHSRPAACASPNPQAGADDSLEALSPVQSSACSIHNGPQALRRPLPMHTRNDEVLGPGREMTGPIAQSSRNNPEPQSGHAKWRANTESNTHQTK